MKQDLVQELAVWMLLLCLLVTGVRIVVEVCGSG